MANIYCDNFLVLLQKDLWLFTWVTMSANISKLLDTEFELTLIYGDPKCHHDALIRVGAYRGTGNKWSSS